MMWPKHHMCIFVIADDSAVIDFGKKRLQVIHRQTRSHVILTKVRRSIPKFLSVIVSSSEYQRVRFSNHPFKQNIFPLF